MKIKSLLNKFSSKGFTLIELLIVIAIMGILAAGILVAINPVQKMNQAKDAKGKNDVTQVAGAAQAYYTSNNAIYAAGIPALVTAKELKVAPSSAMTYTLTANEVSISYTLSAPAVAGNVWCWRSVTGVASEVAAAACVP